MSWPRLLRAAAASTLRPVYYPLYRSGLRLAGHAVDLRESIAGVRGFPPARLRFKIAETFSRRSFLEVGHACAHHVAAAATAAGFGARSWDRPARVLDFGCGCGRVLAAFLDGRATLGVPCRFAGAEVDAECLDWCRSRHPEASFFTSSALPPLPLDGGSFDLIYGVSVFTHLDLGAQRAWLRELHRLLAPGGIAVLTVHGPNAARALPEPLAGQLAREGFLFQRSAKLAGLMPEWYHTAWHTEGFILSEVRRRFAEATYWPVPDGLQDLVIGSRGHP